MMPSSKAAFQSLDELRVSLVGMSGVGKTHLSNILRRSGGWYHYSVDYRLGSAYLVEAINDDLRDTARKVPRLADMLRSDAVSIKAKFGIENLTAMSDYLGRIGDTRRGGLERATFLARQEIHADAEKRAMQDLGHFIQKSRELLLYDHFICDTSGSLCSVVDPMNGEDPILSAMAANTIIVHIEASHQDQQALLSRFNKSPKPIFYSSSFFRQCEDEYLKGSTDWSQVDPNEFATWAFKRIIDFRKPRYAAIADNWGYKMTSEEVRQISSATEFQELLWQKVEDKISSDA